jgi:hypothetical protein
MRNSLFIASMLVSAAALAGHGGAGGSPIGAGGAGMNHSSLGMEHSAAGSQGAERDSSGHPAQEPLRDAQINGGAFRMLERKTGMTTDQLKALYSSSAVRNFGEFTSALVVSKNLGLDSRAVLGGLKTQSLGKTLHTLGVAPDKATAEIKRAKEEIKTAG